MFDEAGHGTTPDLIYARGVPDTPTPDPTSFDKKQCNLIIVEIGFCRDLGCDTKFDKKTENVTVIPRIIGECSTTVEAACSIVFITVVIESC